MIARIQEQTTQDNMITSQRKTASPSATNPHTLQVPRSNICLFGEAWQTIGLPVYAQNRKNKA